VLGVLLTHLRLEPLPRGTQPLQARAALRELIGQLVTTALAVERILVRVRFCRLGQYPLDLLADRGVAAVRAQARIGGDLRTVDRDHADTNESSLGAQPQHLDDRHPSRSQQDRTRREDRHLNFYIARDMLAQSAGV